MADYRDPSPLKAAHPRRTFCCALKILMASNNDWVVPA
jgi:hypothetical protein